MFKFPSLLLIYFAVALVLNLGSALFADYRVALLIGNSEYPDAKLASPAHDVKAMAAVLKQRGFTVTVIENQTGEQVKAAVNKFRRATPTNATALIYFSGYAVQGQRGNDFHDVVLLPVDGDAENPTKALRKPFGVKGLLNDLHAWQHQHVPSGSRASFVIVEGCYAHPLQAGDSPRGLMALKGKIPTSTFVAFACEPGKVLQPTTQGTSPFTTRLVNLLGDSKIPLPAALRDSAGYVESKLADEAQFSRPASRAVASPARMPVTAKAGDEWVNDAGMVFCWCPPGKVTLGSPTDEAMRFDDEEQVDATISHGFWIGKYELSIREYAMFAGRRPSFAYEHPRDFPTTGVDIKESTERVLKPLNTAAQKEGVLPKDWQYALPTEAQWEYAARAGTTTPWYFGDNINELPRHGNFADRQLYQSKSGRYGYAHQSLDDGYEDFSPVGSYLPNPWGLYDVYGNVWEWCEGKYAPRLVGGVDPKGVDNPKERESVARGGCRLSPAEYCRSAMRNGLEPGLKHPSYRFAGFRLVIRKTTP